jgi:competence protein ComEC
VLPGDIERGRERDLAAEFSRMRVDLLVAPHHGSRSSSSAEFVHAVRARYVVFSTGYRNRWHFPAPAVEARWREAGACTLNTAEAGALTFELQGNRLDLVDAEGLAGARAFGVLPTVSNACDESRPAR